MSIEKEIREAVTKYSDMLYKICIVILCNEQDVQDAIQDTFCRYLEKRPSFRDEEHEKAWLIRVATNICRDMIRFRIRHPKISIDELEHSLAAPEHKETLRELLELPVKQNDTFSREYSESEKERTKELWKAYEGGKFPENTLVQVDNEEDAPEGTVCYIIATGIFNLPAQEMTDEEMLEIIDFQHKMSYVVEQSPAAQEARAEKEAEEKQWQERIQAAGGISEAEAIEIATKQMEAELGERAEGKEILKYRDGSAAVFKEDISEETGYEHKGDVAYIVHFYNPNDHSSYECTIDAVDGSVLKTCE